MKQSAGKGDSVSTIYKYTKRLMLVLTVGTLFRCPYIEVGFWGINGLGIELLPD